MVPTGLTRTSADSHRPTPAPRRGVERGVKVADVVGHDDRSLMRELGDEVLAAQFGRIDLQLPRRRFQHPLEQIARFRPPGAAIGVHRRRVGVDRDHLGIDRRDIVLA